jgi:hypothetical protein
MNDVLTPPDMEAVLATMHRDVVWALRAGMSTDTKASASTGLVNAR